MYKNVGRLLLYLAFFLLVCFIFLLLIFVVSSFIHFILYKKS